MRYIDSGTRQPGDALGAWLEAELLAEVVEIRWQAGFFSADALAPFLTTFKRLADDDGLVHGLIGSNDCETLKSHVARLVDALGLPRSNALLGVVSYSGGYFHPKTYHLTRRDKSQAAYVGSANMTAAGIESLHVEAGILLDTKKGDPEPVLTEIARAVDRWFDQSVPGLERINSVADIERLTTANILAVEPPPRIRTGPSSGGGGGSSRPRLKPLLHFPRERPGLTAEAEPSEEVAPVPITSPSAPRVGFPAYVLFAPEAKTPTSGIDALSGSALPGGYVGIIVRLNRDSARHWMGKGGTANISIPVATISTLRFGLFRQKYERPRAEFPLRMRYIFDGGELRSDNSTTNVMVYGASPGETGHGDVRMVVPSPPAAQIAAKVTAGGHLLPTNGDLAFLEWPTPSDASIRMTLAKRGSTLYKSAEKLFAAAEKANQIVGRGACWLPAGIVPAWS